MADKNHLLSILRPHGQEHLLAFWEQLDEAGRARLAAQIEQIDFALVARLYTEKGHEDEFRRIADRAESPPSVKLGDPHNRIGPADARQRGADALKAGRVGAILVAGGQATRLGFDHPKGLFPIGPVSGHSLFQILVEKIVATARRYGAAVPLYLMTSPATHEETLRYFAEHGRFGLAEGDLHVFCQGTMPAVDKDSGHVLLDRPDHVAVSPDGHGGMLAALARSGGLADARRRGIEHLFYFQVDNPMVDVCDPEFLGYHIAAGSEMTTQVVRKQQPLEKVGNVVAVDGRLRVIEYSDLPNDVAYRCQEDGSLVIWAGSIAVHAFDRGFLERMAAAAGSLPFHRARKKVPYVDAAGKRVEPSAPNAVKFERFIFDLMPSARNALVVEVDGKLHFGPLKNATGQAEDTPETVRAMLVARHAQWLRAAGARVAEGVPVEISPLLALDAEELAARIRPGMEITGPTFLERG